MVPIKNWQAIVPSKIMAKKGYRYFRGIIFYPFSNGTISDVSTAQSSAVSMNVSR
jgi:hypothetical protein